MSFQRFTTQIAANHPAFEGHFPGHPVLPGVVLLAEVLSGIERCLGLSLNTAKIKVAKFHAPVLPGSLLTIEIVHAGAIEFTVSCAGTRVATGSITTGAGGEYLPPAPPTPLAAADPGGSDSEAR